MPFRSRRAAHARVVTAAALLTGIARAQASDADAGHLPPSSPSPLPPAPDEPGSATPPSLGAALPSPPPRHKDEPAPATSAAPSPLVSPALPPLVHDGFYLRVSPGIAYGATRVKSDRASQPDYELAGSGLSLDLWLGFGISRGLVLGPAVSYWGVNDGHPAIRRGATSGESGNLLLGAFVDAYPNPRRGEHFGGALALGGVSATLSGRDELEDYRGVGAAFSVFGGYDFWIGKAWSLGGLLKFSGVATRSSSRVDGQQVQRQATSYAASLAITLLYQ